MELGGLHRLILPAQLLSRAGNPPAAVLKGSCSCPPPPGQGSPGTGWKAHRMLHVTVDALKGGLEPQKKGCPERLPQGPARNGVRGGGALGG